MCKFGYSIHSQLILGVKYNVVFLILVFYTSFSIIFGILEALFQVFWYSTTPPWPTLLNMVAASFFLDLSLFCKMYLDIYTIHSCPVKNTFLRQQPRIIIRELYICQTETAFTCC